MGLFKPAWMTDDSKKAGKAVAAVGKVADQATLARIAREAPLGETRTAAAARLTDQEALLEVATSNWWFEARKAAIERMDDAHLVRFAGKVPTKECINACHYSPEPDEVFAVGRIQSSGALAALYLLLQGNRGPRSQVKEYPHWSGYGPKSACETVLEARMDEAACVTAARTMLANGQAVDPAGFLGSRIQSPELRGELGIDVDKEELMAQLRNGRPAGMAKPARVFLADTARLLWPQLDSSEKKEMQRSLSAHLSVLMPDPKSFDDLIGFIDDPELYVKLLFVNPNHERNLTQLIERIDDPAVLRRFLDMLDSRRIFTYPAITRPPDPAGDNFVIHTNYGNDNWAITRVKSAAKMRLALLK